MPPSWDSVGWTCPNLTLGKASSLFMSPEPAGRRILFGFSYLKNIGKNAATHAWFAPSFQEDIAARIQSGDASVLEQFRVDWAAVRQFELLQESGNGEIYPLEITNHRFAFKMLMRQRAGGVRVTLITMGLYVDPLEYDELAILDRRLQDAIAQFVSMLYLEEQSAISQAGLDDLISTGQWRYDKALPHVAMALGGERILRPLRSSRATERFFQLLEMLPAGQISHDIVLGLQIPDAAARNEEIRIIPMEQRYCAFQTALTNIFRGFDRLSLGQLHERRDAASEVKAVTGHMRCYGDHMQNGGAELYRRLAVLARGMESARDAPKP
ncbi:MAG: hypothetical protein HGA90_01000 [Alphaproteobacteria bacterium]|nr:hypothetical protein [Alphaproteobacteria bacterium]